MNRIIAWGVIPILAVVVITLGFFAPISSFLLAGFFLALLPVPWPLRKNRVEKESADIDVLVLDKAEIIAGSDIHEIIPTANVSREEVAKAAFFASCADKSSSDTRVIIDYVTRTFPVLANRLADEMPNAKNEEGGVRVNTHLYRKGAQNAIEKLVMDTLPHDLESAAMMIARQGSTPLLIAKDDHILGVIALREYVKPESVALCEKLRALQVRSVLISHDSWLTLSAIARQMHLEEFQAEMSPQGKQRYIQKLQGQGLVVSTEGNLESTVHTIENERQRLCVSGAAHVFSLTGIAAKSLAVVPALLIPMHPQLQLLNFLGFKTQAAGIFSAILYNLLAVICAPFFFRLAIKKTQGSSVRAQLFFWGMCGLIAPWIVMKAFSMFMPGG